MPYPYLEQIRAESRLLYNEMIFFVHLYTYFIVFRELM